MYSNGYIFRYAAILVIIAAALLSTAAMMLKPFQERNMAIEKMDGILASANIVDISKEETIKKFNQYVTEAIVVDHDGKVVEDLKEGEKENGTAFKINMKEELYRHSNGMDYKLPLYKINKDNKIIYIFPLYGTGLWGPIWGNLAIAADLNTVVGVTFGDKGETPGLGAEIATQGFQQQFIGKKLFDENNNFTSIKVVKGGVKTLPADQQIHGVDAVSGGTITSNGVDKMLKDVLELYLPYIEKQK
jgi:Na+-transporting NADH:ubiquinone oxidoreductase subunit C